MKVRYWFRAFGNSQIESLDELSDYEGRDIRSDFEILSGLEGESDLREVGGVFRDGELVGYRVTDFTDVTSKKSYLDVLIENKPWLDPTNWYSEIVEDDSRITPTFRQISCVEFCLNELDKNLVEVVKKEVCVS